MSPWSCAHMQRRPQVFKSRNSMRHTVLVAKLSCPGRPQTWLHVSTSSDSFSGMERDACYTCRRRPVLPRRTAPWASLSLRYELGCACDALNALSAACTGPQQVGGHLPAGLSGRRHAGGPQAAGRPRPEPDRRRARRRASQVCVYRRHQPRGPPAAARRRHCLLHPQQRALGDVLPYSQ